MKKIDFKNIKKRYYVLAFLILILVLFVGTIISYSRDPKSDFDAMICHSVLKDNNGYIYCYNIYAKDDTHYTYVETKRKIKDGKNGSIRRVKSGKINSEKDYDKLVNTLSKDNKKEYNSLVSCTYVDNGINMYYDDTNVLKNYLFNKDIIE